MASPRSGGEPSWWVVVDGDLLWATIVVLSLALASGMPVESEKMGIFRSKVSRPRI